MEVANPNKLLLYTAILGADGKDIFIHFTNSMNGKI